MASLFTLPKSVFAYFFYLFIKPPETINRIIGEKPSFQSIAVFLLVIGTLRGVIELFWELLMAGQFTQTIVTPILFKRQILLDGAVFVFGNITTAFVRWPIYALIPFIFNLFLGGKVRFHVFLRLYGLILGVFVVPVLGNFVYLFGEFPLIQFQISKAYNPIFGFGQLIACLLTIFVSCKIIRVTNRFPWAESIFISVLIPLINIGMLVLCAKIFFNFPFILAMPERKAFFVAAITFAIVTLTASPLLLWLGLKIDEKKFGRKAP